MLLKQWWKDKILLKKVETSQKTETWNSEKDQRPGLTTGYMCFGLDWILILKLRFLYECEHGVNTLVNGPRLCAAD